MANFILDGKKGDRVSINYSRSNIFNKDFYAFISGSKYNPGGGSAKHVLLTGATGFLGIHVLYQLLKKERNVYCIIRRQTTEKAKADLTQLLKFYFGKDYQNLLSDRLHILCGDVTQKQFGLSEEEYNELGNQVDVVIHAAANTKHYGNGKEFFTVNVRGTRNVAEFCLKHSAFLYHVSTMSIFGHGYPKGHGGRASLTEKQFDIGQNLSENIYIKSKWRAERLIYRMARYGLHASVLRIGQLTGRYHDGRCQVNVQDNALFSRLRAMMDLRVVPESMKMMTMEFTPVDCCSQAIDKILDKDNTGKIYHLYNHHMVTIDRFLSAVKKIGISVCWISNDKFRKIISSETNIHRVTGLNEYFNLGDRPADYDNLKTSSEDTQKCLNMLGFRWPEIDVSYLVRMIRHVKEPE